MVSTPAYTTDFVISKDSTKIGYRILGQGPGLVVVHGSMSSGYYHLELAQSLSSTFTVYLVDRRGRGLSGPYHEDHTIEKDVEDIKAVLAKTGAHNIFAVSVGAVISLKTALSESAIQKLAVYEPLFFPTKIAASTVMMRYDKEMNEGNTIAALATAMKGAQMGPPFMNVLPHWLVAFMTRGMANWTPPGEYIPFKNLVVPLHYEGQIIIEMSDKQDSLKAIQAKVLLLGGGASSTFLKRALDRLEHIIPHVSRIEFPNLNHGSSWNKAVRGNPESIAQELRKFFRD